MIGEACFFTLMPPTTPCEAHQHSTQFLNIRLFPTRSTFIGNTPSARLLLCSAHKSNFNVKSAPTTGFAKRKKRKVEDDPWESLFQQLEKDLENDADDSNEEEITEEDVANFEMELDTLVEELASASLDKSKASELDEVLGALSEDNAKDDDDHGLVDEDRVIHARQNTKDDHDKDLVEAGEGSEDDDEDAVYEFADNDEDDDLSDDDFEEPRTVTLQKWQLRKLAAAIELGRRKVHIKRLAAELQLDREDVIFFLKNPPPELLMAVSEMEGNANEDDESESDKEEVEADSEKMNDSRSLNVSSINNDSDLIEGKETKKPTYGSRDWYKGKRIKKTNMLTLERVYKRSRWPSNSMIESLVQLTHLPRSRILVWFEEERAKGGVQSHPRQSSASRKTWKRPVTHSFERLE